MTLERNPKPRVQPHKIVWLLCALAAVHVFVFSAAFPFFNNVDEAAHFDLVVKYSHGHLPQGMETISDDSARYIALMNSHAYYGIAGKDMPTPAWMLSPDKMKEEIAATGAGWMKLPNYEAPQAPLYYVIAGFWWNVGEGLGFHDGRLVYWLRFLNIAIVGAGIWLGYIATIFIFPENKFMQVGVPALIAFMPQTAFYSIGNDVLSPVCFGLAFICTIRWLQTEHPSLLQGAITGLVFAATWLTKATNLPLLAVAGLAIAIKTGLLLRKESRRALEGFMAFAGCAGAPVVGWMLRCEREFGDYTGSSAMTNFFGWTVKPFPEWWHHPIFSPYGVWTYLTGQIGTFWQGELRWLNHPLCLPGSNTIYTLITIVLLAAVLPRLFRGISDQAVLQRRNALALGLACFLAAVAFFALVSIIYDFHNAPNPTREHPYVQEGRLMLGALIPFAMLFVSGFDQLLKRFGNTVKFSALGAMILAMIITEIATDWPVFGNPFNWFHLP